MVSHNGLSVASLSAEHTIFQLDNPDLKMQLGERVTVIPPCTSQLSPPIPNRFPLLLLDASCWFWLVLTARWLGQTRTRR